MSGDLTTQRRRKKKMSEADLFAPVSKNAAQEPAPSDTPAPATEEMVVTNQAPPPATTADEVIVAEPAASVEVPQVSAAAEAESIDTEPAVEDQDPVAPAAAFTFPAPKVTAPHPAPLAEDSADTSAAPVPEPAAQTPPQEPAAPVLVDPVQPVPQQPAVPAAEDIVAVTQSEIAAAPAEPEPVVGPADETVDDGHIGEVSIGLFTDDPSPDDAPEPAAPEESAADDGMASVDLEDLIVDAPNVEDLWSDDGTETEPVELDVIDGEEHKVRSDDDLPEFVAPLPSAALLAEIDQVPEPVVDPTSAGTGDISYVATGDEDWAGPATPSAEAWGATPSTEGWGAPSSEGWDQPSPVASFEVWGTPEPVTSAEAWGTPEPVTSAEAWGTPEPATSAEAWGTDPATPTPPSSAETWATTPQPPAPNPNWPSPDGSSWPEQTISNTQPAWSGPAPDWDSPASGLATVDEPLDPVVPDEVVEGPAPTEVSPLAHERGAKEQTGRFVAGDAIAYGILGRKAFSDDEDTDDDEDVSPHEKLRHQDIEVTDPKLAALVERAKQSPGVLSVDTLSKLHPQEGSNVARKRRQRKEPTKVPPLVVLIVIIISTALMVLYTSVAG